MPARNAFVYDFLLVRGGAEAVALEFGKAFPDYDLLFGFVERSQFPERDFPSDVFRSLTGATSIRGWQGLKVMSAFSRHGGFLVDYDQVLFSGVYAPVGVNHRAAGGNAYYCHTPPRFVYDLKQYYLDTVPAWQRPLLNALIPFVRRQYEQALSKMDLVIANSANVQQRLKKYVGVDAAKVVYPPVDTDRFKWRGQDAYYLSTARLEPYKQVDQVIRAFMRMPNTRLVVASGGSESARLRAMAASCDNIEFTGWCDHDRMSELLGRCTASIYLAPDEDFGMSPVESMAAGKPVIGAGSGGLKESVVHGRTGILIPVQQLETPDSAVEAIIEAVRRMDGEAPGMRASCEEQAQRFGIARFRQRMKTLLQDQVS